MQVLTPNFFEVPNNEHLATNLVPNNAALKKFEIFPKQTDAILSHFFIFPGKSLICCHGASVLNENSERENSLLLSLLFEEL